MTPQILRITIIAAVSLMFWGCDNCRKSKCQNDGYCYDGECICEKWYSGDDCQLLYNRNYEGRYKGVSYEDGRSVTKEINVIADLILPNRLHLQSGIYYDLETDSSFVIPAQSYTYNSDTITIVGDGHYDTGFISYSFNEQLDPLVSKPSSVLQAFEGERIEE